MTVFKSGVERKTDGMVAMVKKSTPVYMRKMEEPFEVEAKFGTVRGEAGDFLAYDPISKHTWPVTAEYVALHYEPQ